MSLILVMLAHQCCKNGCEQCENQCLNGTDQQLQQVKGQYQEPSEEPTPHVHHRLQNVFPGKNIAIQTEHQCNRADTDRNNLHHSDEKEDEHKENA